MIKLKPLSTEAGLEANNTVSNATLVRIVNDSGNTVLITAPSGSFTMLNNTSETIVKRGDEEISASANVKACSVAYY